MLDAAREHAPDCVFNVRVTHASGMLEGKYTEATVFADACNIRLIEGTALKDLLARGRLGSSRH